MNDKKRHMKIVIDFDWTTPGEKQVSPKSQKCCNLAIVKIAKQFWTSSRKLLKCTYKNDQSTDAHYVASLQHSEEWFCNKAKKNGKGSSKREGKSPERATTAAFNNRTGTIRLEMLPCGKWTATQVAGEREWTKSDKLFSYYIIRNKKEEKWRKRKTVFSLKLIWEEIDNLAR